jgi:CheY-like chemotaxis protein
VPDVRQGEVVKRRVLLAEDNSVLNEIIQIELKALDYDVIVATNGREALEMATSKEADLIIMDLMMPELDGFQAASQIRRNPKTQATPMLAITGFTVTEAREKCLASGFDDCIAKPFTFPELKGVIEKTLKERLLS